MRLYKYINELSMGSNTKITIDINSYDGFFATITMFDNEAENKFYFEAYRSDWASLVYKTLQEVGVNPKNISALYESVFKNEHFEITFKDEKYKLTQIKKTPKIALQVFAAVEELTKQFIKSRKPLIFSFSAKTTEPSRVKLYDLLSKKITKLSKKYIKAEIKIEDKHYVFVDKSKMKVKKGI